ncbi:hypothetical protein [Methylomonas methanica]|uniref:Porin n=1 Tax=Methylomonas methanica (strain DSM 25384 / MC09) TaxID=857087 RepID=G0A5X2_METMM|nr:hypothetical protein [Methylomonas methanica]AEF99249.1 hypothetical protein Metme_0810 [Methylomonas methanica MC09]
MSVGKIGRLFHLMALTALSTVWPCLADSGPDFPEFSSHGLLDLRYQQAQAAAGETEHGLGKFRSGGDRLYVNEAAVTLKMKLDWDWSATLTAKYANRQEQPLDISEGFLAYRPINTGGWALSARLGMFFPPISLENTGTAWSSPYTLNSSAINSWVGEELRSLGGEARLDYRLYTGDRLSLFGAGLANNDTAGVLLAWRGWSLADYEATLHDRLRLPTGIGINNVFPKQAPYTRPFVEVDGRPGYYAGLQAEQRDAYRLRVLYYDNRADPAAINNGQYAWHTRFWSLGLKAELPWQLTLISQGLSGRTQMGALIGAERAVDTEFWSASILLSKAVGKHRFSLRHDRFGADERDYFPQDPNQEHGNAWTANYNLTLAQRHQLNFEVSHIISDRPARSALSQSPRREETLWQIAYRVFF